MSGIPDPDDALLQLLIWLGVPTAVTIVVGSFLAILGWVSLARSSAHHGANLIEALKAGSAAVPGGAKFGLLFALASIPFLVLLYVSSQFIAATFGWIEGLRFPGWEITIEFWLSALAFEKWSELSTGSLTAGVLTLLLVFFGRLGRARWTVLLAGGIWALPLGLLFVVGFLTLFPVVGLGALGLFGGFSEALTPSDVLAFVAVVVAFCGLGGTATLLRALADPEEGLLD